MTDLAAEGGGSSHFPNRLLQQFVGQMVQPFGHSQLHGGAQDAPGVARRSILTRRYRLISMCI
ncbi:hypothetical protein [Trinickia symbiotica]|uniref:hypothetical protein n=1 Tax=Trinickia symbiotica TaxID=863227 RepID=UPI0015E71A53|nr:hypothetical protein [Trinickia symbiotica]